MKQNLLFSVFTIVFNCQAAKNALPNASIEEAEYIFGLEFFSKQIFALLERKKESLGVHSESFRFMRVRVSCGAV